MVDAYLRWKQRDHCAEDCEHNAPDQFSQHNTPDPTSGSPSNKSADASSEWDFSIATVDLFTLATEVRITRTEDQAAAVALVCHGYIGNAPQRPSLAFSLRTLEHFRRLRLYKPSFSTEAYVKLLCHYYVVSSLFEWI